MILIADSDPVRKFIKFIFEKVRWFVMREWISASKAQIEKIRSLVGHNTRPVVNRIIDNNQRFTGFNFEYGLKGQQDPDNYYYPSKKPKN
jgi:hypothetical protein